MKMYIPNTTVEGKILNPVTEKGFVSIFIKENDPESTERILSVNAGTSNAGSIFAVGLGGINGAFSSALEKAGQTSDAYQEIHHHLFTSVDEENLAVKTKFNDDDPVKFSLMLKPKDEFNLNGYDGIVFIDIFNNAQIPHNNPLNYGMVYLVPPKRSNYEDENSFLHAIEASSTTIANAVELYNTKYVNEHAGLKTIECIRMCLFSGGIYSGGVSKSKIAVSNLNGLEAGFTDEAITQSVAFENSYDRASESYIFNAVINELETK